LQKIIIIAAPSGSGKTTLVKKLLSQYPVFGFSISCTTRAPRGEEQDGVDYYFITEEAFHQKITDDAFLEWENVYEGLYYGTLKSEIDRIHAQDMWPLLDIDVYGAVNLKKKYGSDVLSIFIKAPSIDELRRRLVQRQTDTPEVIEKRIQKAEHELLFASQFDHVVINDDIDQAMKDLTQILQEAGILS